MLRPFCFEEMFSLTFAEDEATLFSFLLCSVFPALFFFPALSFLVANATTKLSAGDQISNLSTKVISFCHFSCFFFFGFVHYSIFFIPSQSNQSDLFQRSILGPILPEAMVCYLENHGKRSFLLLPQVCDFLQPFWFIG